MVEKKYYLFKDGELFFNDFVLVIDGDEFKHRSLHYVHLGERATRIGANTFEGNYLTQIHFHKKIKWIESQAFANNKIEKIIFSRLEVPQIAQDAFVHNPVSLIIVPYETIDDYKRVLSCVEFDQDVQVISNIEMKFIRLNEEKIDDTMIIIKALPVYGTYIWRIEKVETSEMESRMRRNENKSDFGELSVNNRIYQVYKDDHQQVILYRKEKGEYLDMCFEDFEALYQDARRVIL